MHIEADVIDYSPRRVVSLNCICSSLFHFNGGNGSQQQTIAGSGTGHIAVAPLRRMK
jgi:hypothetical protein